MFRNTCFILLLSSFLQMPAAAQNLVPVVQQGHTNGVHKAVFSPDGKHLASTSTDGALKIWDVYSGKLQRTLLSRDWFVEDLFYTPDGRRLVGAADESRLLAWETKGWRLVEDKLLGEGCLSSMAITPDSRFLITGTDEGRIDCRRLPGLQRSRRFRHPDGDEWVSLDASPDGKYLLAGDDSGLSFLLDMEKGFRLTRTFEGNRAQFSGDGRQILFSDDNNRLHLADLDGEPLLLVEEATKPCLDPQGRYLAALSSRHGQMMNIRVWAAGSGELIHEMEGHAFYVNSLAFSPDGRYLASASSDRTIKIWDVRSGRAIRKLPGDYAGRPARILSLDYEPVKKQLACGTDDGYIRIWTMENLQLSALLRDTGRSVSALRFLPGGDQIFSGNASGEVSCWATAAPACLFTLHTGKEVRSLDFEPEGRRLLAGGWNGAAALFRAYPDTAVFLNNTDGPAFFGPGGRIVAHAGVGEVAASFPDGALATVGLGGYLAVSPSRSLAAVNKESHIEIRSLPAGALLRRIKTEEEAYRVMAFSPDGAYLAEGSAFGALRLWSVESGDLLWEAKAHAGIVWGIDFIDGLSLLVSGGEDGYLNFWDIHSGEMAASIILVPKTNQIIAPAEYVILTPEGYYTGTPGGFRSVAFEWQGRMYPMEQFDLSRNRPDLVLERLDLGAPELVSAFRQVHLKRLERHGLSPEKLEAPLHLPEVRITNLEGLMEKQGFITSQDTLPIDIFAKDSLAPLHTLYVWVNNNPFPDSRGFVLSGLNARQVERTARVPLAPGENVIEVSVLNAAGQESLRETLAITCTNEGRAPRLYLIGLAAEQYADSRFNLDYPARDIRDLFGLFESRAEQYDTIFRQVLIDEELTQEGLRNIRKLLEQSRPEDKALLFVAGHGLIDADLNFYLASPEVDFSNPRDGGIPFSELEALLDGIPAHDKLFLIDACYSGELDKECVEWMKRQGQNNEEVKFRSFPDVPGPKRLNAADCSFDLLSTFFDDLRRGSGATVISSAGGAELAIEGGEWNNSVFTFCLLRGLRDGRADRNNNEQITLSELREYLLEQVPLVSGGLQNPTSRLLNTARDWRVW